MTIKESQMMKIAMQTVGVLDGAGSGIRTHAVQRTTDSQGLRVIHSAIPAITVFLDANL